MPRRTDIKKIMICGSGPIVIGQACEFDYSGTQACKALKEEGYQIVLLNSNPATIMTDPGFADRTYIEPMTPEVAEQIIAREKPDVLLPTLGGQTALNLAVALAKNGALKRHGVELIGASLEAIEKAEDRLLFKQAMKRVGVEMPKSGYATSWEEASVIADDIGFPVIIRPSFTMGGEGGGVAYNREEFEPMARRALTLSPTHTILCEESIIGWKEYELEVMRDRNDNVVIICSIENFDPMGVHTGDSITVAPAQTLTDKEYQVMRDAAVRIIREIGVDTGGSNIQFGTDPRTGRLVVIEMNPRVSRSSALASKATGFPIAKIAAKLAVGYTLDEIKNDITRYTPASFEPTIDYVVTKIPRFAFEKFKGADDTLTTAMKSVGEVMAMGRTFQESLQKAIRGLEIDRCGFESPLQKRPGEPFTAAEKGRVDAEIRVPRAHRLFWLGDAFRAGMTVDEVHAATAIDPWFLREIEEIVATEQELGRGLPQGRDAWYRIKRMGFSDKRIAQLAGQKEAAAREARWAVGVRPVFKRVDTCAAEFEAHTPYLYSTYEEECEAAPTDRPKVMILGGGPNRIGQGIEFDYCCVHAAFALTKAGFETIMVNCNPETVSTDYDTSDRLYFEPLTLEDVLEIVHREKPKGLIVQYGGPDAAQAGGAAPRAGRAHLRHQPRRHRPGRGPRAVLPDDRQAQAAPAGERHGQERRGGLRGGPAHRLPGHGAPLLRAGRPGHGGGLRRRRPARLPDRRGAGLQRPAGPHRPLPQGRGRGGRRRGVRRQGRGGGRGHGAHRGGRHPLRRLGLLAAALQPGAGAGGRDRAAVDRHGPRAGRGRPDERPVRRAGRGRLRPRGQPARQPHRAVRGQGHRPAAGQGRRPLHGGQDPRRGRRHRPGAPAATSRSRRRSSRSPASAASTTCSARRCAPPAR